MTSTSHPIFFNKFNAKSFAAPPPLSITILGVFSIWPIIFLASSMYVDFIFLIYLFLTSKFLDDLLFEEVLFH
jgi:hypothetical protein